MNARPARAALLLAAAAAALPAHAVLGGDAGSVESDRLRLRASRQSAAAPIAGAVQQVQLADGSTIRQYLNPQGVVYAVAWNTRTKPDLRSLLGPHAAAFEAAAADAARRPGLKRLAAVEQDDLVVVSSGRPGAFVGRAWLKSQVPAGMHPDAAR